MHTPKTIETAVRDSIAQVKSDDSLSPGLDEEFENIDIDSLDRMSIMLQVEQKLELNLEEVDPNELGTIQKYIDFIQALDQ